MDLSVAGNFVTLLVTVEARLPSVSLRPPNLIEPAARRSQQP